VLVLWRNVLVLWRNVLDIVEECAGIVEECAGCFFRFVVKSLGVMSNRAHP